MHLFLCVDHRSVYMCFSPWDYVLSKFLLVVLLLVMLLRNVLALHLTIHICVYARAYMRACVVCARTCMC